MFDRFDPRSEDARNRGSALDREWGSRGGTRRDDRGDADELFGSHFDLPRGLEREVVRDRERSYELNGAESGALDTVGRFRVVRMDDLQDILDRGCPDRSARESVRHLQESGLLERIPLDSRDRDVAVLTERGRELLEANRRERDGEGRQAFYCGLRKPRELTHDAHVYRACRHASQNLRARGEDVRRVVLDYELKREYQQFLQERNRGRADSTGRPDRTPEEIEAWALAHRLPYEDGHVRFPDARLEYEDRHREVQYEDIEVVTPHYRGAHAAGVAGSGARRYGVGFGVRTSGGRGGRARGSRSLDELLG